MLMMVNISVAVEVVEISNQEKIQIESYFGVLRYIS